MKTSNPSVKNRVRPAPAKKSHTRGGKSRPAVRPVKHADEGGPSGSVRPAQLPDQGYEDGWKAGLAKGYEDGLDSMYLSEE